MSKPSVTQRSQSQLREHYEVEKQLANRLRNASKTERRTLYAQVYDELFRKVPHHPQLSKKADPFLQDQIVAGHLKLLRRFVTPETVFVEVGPGDCSLAYAVAKRTKQVYAVDVSEEITRTTVATPPNFTLIITDGSNIPLLPATSAVCFSNQLIEHLHPEDARDHLRSVQQILKPGGVYICLTPNRLSGPHDISRYFDEVATGFHMKEYTVTELTQDFLQAGFSKVLVAIGIKGHFLIAPASCARFLERCLAILPHGLRRTLAGSRVLTPLLGIHIVGVK